MTNIAAAGTFRLGDRTVNRMGYGAMQLAGPGVFGPPKDRGEAIAVLREAVAAGVNLAAAELRLSDEVMAQLNAMQSQR